MSIADKILRAKADLDAVYEAGKASGGGGSHTSCFDGTINGEYIDDEIKYLRYGAFADCKNITKVSLPSCEEFGGNYVFYNMVDVTEFSLPKVKRGSFGATFMGCSSVTKIDLSGLGGAEIGAQCFRNCPNLQTVILGGNTMNTLANTNALLGTPTTMSIYVPDDLVDDYKANSTWASYVSRIKPRSALEG